jgi:hypothetical protein
MATLQLEDQTALFFQTLTNATQVQVNTKLPAPRVMLAAEQAQPVTATVITLLKRSQM